MRNPPPTTGMFTKIPQKGGTINRGAVSTQFNTKFAVGGRAGYPNYEVTSGQPSEMRENGGNQQYHTPLVNSSGQKGGSVYYGANQEEGNLENFRGSYVPVKRNTHTPQCGGRKTRRKRKGGKRRTKHHKRNNKKRTKHRKRRTRHHKRHTRRHRRKHRQRGGGLVEEMEESFRVHTGSGTNTLSHGSNMEPGDQGRMAIKGGYETTNNCYDNYNHYEAMSSGRQ